MNTSCSLLDNRVRGRKANGSGPPDRVPRAVRLVLAVDGHHSVVVLVEIGQYGASASSLHVWLVQCCQHVVHTMILCDIRVGSNEQPSAGGDGP